MGIGRERFLNRQFLFPVFRISQWCVSRSAVILVSFRKRTAGPGLARYAYAALAELYGMLPKVYALGVALPDGPLEAFRAAVRDLPKATEAERLVVQRVGQEIFRDRLMTYWQGGCPLTGITDPALLRASHIIPWKDCSDDAERLNVHNGLLLSALWDAAFDRGLVTFDDDGRPVFSPALSKAARDELRWKRPVPLTDKHRMRLAWHRAHPFAKAASGSGGGDSSG